LNLGKKILLLLKDEISEIEYKRYISQLSYDLENSKSDLAIFNAPNPLIANWAKTRYKKKIAHLFEVETEVQTDVQIKHKKESFGTLKDILITKPTQQKSNKISLLNPSYTFANFVVGSSNQFSYTAAVSVAENPAKGYNPLFIYGGVGLGKTHLLQAIGNVIQENSGSVIYTTIEQFLNDFTRHMRNQTMDRFKEKYRKCDMLIIDDIQFLSGKKQTQEEFFHTFNDLHAQRSQIVLAADKHPKQIAGLEERLQSRFEWGLVADIQPPELETKIAIIKKKCELDRVALSNEIINYIATIISNNAREIEGILTKLHAHATLMNQEITLEFTKNVLKEQIREKRDSITIEHIMTIIAKELNIKPSEIRSKNRSRNIVYARRISIYLCRTLTPNSMPTLAQYFGMKDHTAVSHTMKKISQMLKEDENFRLKVEELSNKISLDDNPK